VPGRHINDQQVRIYMRLRTDHTQATGPPRVGCLSRPPRVSIMIRDRQAPRSNGGVIEPPRPSGQPMGPADRSDATGCTRPAPDHPLRRVGAAPSRPCRSISPTHARTACRGLEGSARVRSRRHRPTNPATRHGPVRFHRRRSLGVVVAGQRFEHRLYHFALACSGFDMPIDTKTGKSRPGDRAEAATSPINGGFGS
jgi:hypothetical protein